jgi:TPR repeat protein
MAAYAKAEYAVGYFKEVGIGCKQDALEANMWYWRAAQQGEERAKQRMAAIHQAASGGAAPSGTDSAKSKKGLLSKLGL